MPVERSDRQVTYVKLGVLGGLLSLSLIGLTATFNVGPFKVTIERGLASGDVTVADSIAQPAIDSVPTPASLTLTPSNE